MLSAARVFHIVAAVTVASAIVLRQPTFGTTQNNGSLSQLALSPGASLEGPLYVCDGDRFGYVLSLQSCANANRKMVRSTSLRSWGPRNQERYDVGLPHRWISCKGSM